MNNQKLKKHLRIIYEEEQKLYKEKLIEEIKYREEHACGRIGDVYQNFIFLDYFTYLGRSKNENKQFTIREFN